MKISENDIGEKIAINLENVHPCRRATSPQAGYFIVARLCFLVLTVSPPIISDIFLLFEPALEGEDALLRFYDIQIIVVVVKMVNMNLKKQMVFRIFIKYECILII